MGGRIDGRTDEQTDGWYDMNDMRYHNGGYRTPV